MVDTAAVKDIVIAVAVVGGILLGLTLYTGVWPPVVVVESGSMMHAAEEAGFGKVGTIDPGDMVFVKSVAKREDIATFADERWESYGSPGSVLIYRALKDADGTPIIHRAMLWIEAQGVTQLSVQENFRQLPSRVVRSLEVQCNTDDAVYAYRWDGQDLTTSPGEGVTIPALGLNDYKPCWSGFVTQGDNPITNRNADQSTGLMPQPVAIDPLLAPGDGRVLLAPLQGKAEAEIPWFGLIKLALGGSPNYVCSHPDDPACVNVWVVGNARSPSDLWISLAVSLAALVLVPMGFDYFMAMRREAQEEAAAEDTASMPDPDPAGAVAEPPEGDSEHGDEDETSADSSERP